MFVEPPSTPQRVEEQTTAMSPGTAGTEPSQKVTEEKAVKLEVKTSGLETTQKKEN